MCAVASGSNGSPLLQFALEAGPVQQLHDEERPLLGVHVEIEDGDDVGVPELRADTALAQEALAD